MIPSISWFNFHDFEEKFKKKYWDFFFFFDFDFFFLIFQNFFLLFSHLHWLMSEKILVRNDNYKKCRLKIAIWIMKKMNISWKKAQKMDFRIFLDPFWGSTLKTVLGSHDPHISWLLFGTKKKPSVPQCKVELIKYNYFFS